LPKPSCLAWTQPDVGALTKLLRYRPNGWSLIAVSRERERAVIPGGTGFDDDGSRELDVRLLFLSASRRARVAGVIPFDYLHIRDRCCKRFEPNRLSSSRAAECSAWRAVSPDRCGEVFDSLESPTRRHQMLQRQCAEVTPAKIKRRDVWIALYGVIKVVTIHV